MIEFSPNVATLNPSATTAVFTRVKQLIAQGRDVLDLTVGEPDFATPDFIAEAGIRAIREGRTRYTPVAGIPPLRAAIAADLARLSGLEALDPQAVVVSTGGKQALFNVCFSLFGPGDRVLYPVPSWTSYPEIVRLARAEPVAVPGDPERGFKIGVAELERAARGGAKGLCLNSPCNPTGAVYSLAELEQIARWAAERGVWLVSDEIYRRLYYREGSLAPGVLDLPAELRERVVLIDGASKAFAMTGWRIGFSLSPRELADKVTALQSQTTTNPNTVAQYAALAAYQEPARTEAAIERMRRSFQHRRDVLTRLLPERLPRLHFLEPEGAFYLWIGTAGLARPGEDSVALCERLLQETGVGIVPGAAFGDDRFVRLSFAYPEETLRAAVDRLAAWSAG